MQSSSQPAPQPAHVSAHKYLKDLQHYEGLLNDKVKDEKATTVPDSKEGEGEVKKAKADDDVLGELKLLR